jgi:hypothetical protein
VFFVGSKLDPGDQQLVNGWQQTRIDCPLIPNVLNYDRHTQNPQPWANDRHE